MVFDHPGVTQRRPLPHFGIEVQRWRTKELLRVEIQEVIRHWQAEGSQRQIGVGRGMRREQTWTFICITRGSVE